MPTASHCTGWKPRWDDPASTCAAARSDTGSSAPARGVEPWTYLNAVLTELLTRPDGADISDLLQWRFAQRQQPTSAIPSTSA